MRIGITTSIATAIAIGVLIASGGSNGSGCPLPAYPDASCTGVPAGTTLTAYTGPNPVTVNGTVIDSKTMGCIEVQASGVVIKNSQITCSDIYTVHVDDSLTLGITPLLVEDSEIACNGPGNAFGDANITARRVNIHDCENGFEVNQNITVEDSYIHDLYTSVEAHPDGLQFSAGHWNGSNYVCCVLNLTVRHNTIYARNRDGSDANAAIISGRGGDTNILIENNLFAAGGYTLYCEQDGTVYSGTSGVTNNHFSTAFYPTVGFYGPSAECSDENLSGNVYHETGFPITLG